MKLETLNKKLKGFVNVQNMCSITTGKEVPNQYILTYTNGKVFKSYGSIIVIKYDDKVYLTKKWNYSVTTGKYRNQFLGEGIKETKEKLTKGIYKIVS